MIYSKLTELKKYLPQNYIIPIQGFLQLLSPEMEEGFYPILQDKVYARVMSYQTIEQCDCNIEAHNRYIDIQSTITGAEGIDIFDRDSLKVSKEYLAEEDVAFFKADCSALLGSTKNYPGYFTMIFPNEAHRPQERIADITKVKKFVIKMEVTDFESQL